MLENYVIGTDLNKSKNELFSLSRGKKPTLFSLLYILVLGIPLVCLASLITAIVIGTIGDNFGYTGNPAAYFMIFMLWSLAWLSQFFIGIKELKINEDRLALKLFLRKQKTIQKNEIKQITWKRNKIQLIGAKHKVILNFNKLTLQENIQVSHVLAFKWLPYDLLPKPFQQSLDQFRNNHEQMQHVFETTSTSSNSSRSRKLFGGVGISTLIIITVLFSWFLLSDNDATKYLITFLFIAATVPIALSLIQLSKFRQINANSKGITYRSGKKTKYIDWNNIDAIFWSRNQQQIQIWEKGCKRYAPIQYKHMQSADVDAIFRHVQASVYLLDIPFAMN